MHPGRENTPRRAEKWAGHPLLQCVAPHQPMVRIVADYTISFALQKHTWFVLLLSLWGCEGFAGLPLPFGVYISAPKQTCDSLLSRNNKYPAKYGVLNSPKIEKPYSHSCIRISRRIVEWDNRSITHSRFPCSSLRFGLAMEKQSVVPIDLLYLGIGRAACFAEQLAIVDLFIALLSLALIIQLTHKR